MNWVWMRKAALFLAIFIATAGLATAADGVRVLRDMDYIVGAAYEDLKDKLDLYLPDGADNFPVVVFFHGGGLRQGDKNESEHVGRALAAAGYGAAIVNYRLSPTVSHPKHAQDAAASIAWVYHHIERFGGNPNKIFIAGWSAGAYLAGLLALDERYLKEQDLSLENLSGAMPISGFFYVDQIAPDRPKDVWGEDKKVWVEASPSQYVRADGPPILFLYADGDSDWRRKQNQDLAKELEAKGHADVEAVQIDNRDHNGMWKQIGPKDPVFEAMIAFMSER
jgi:acetyl esterase/lipase